MANEMIIRNGLKIGGSGGIAIGSILNENDLASNSAAALATQASIKSYVDNQVGGLASALEFKGEWDASTAAYPVDPTTGDTYVVTTAGTISGEVLEVGDLIICSDGTTDEWVAVQKNLDGIVTSIAATTTDRAIAVFNGVGGESLDTSEVVISTDGTLAGDADTNIPTEKAVKLYIDNGLATKQNTLTFGIADTNSVVIDSADVAATEYSRFTANGLEGRTPAEVKQDLALDNVTNHAQIRKLDPLQVTDEHVLIWDGGTGDTVKASGISKSDLNAGLFVAFSGTNTIEFLKAPVGDFFFEGSAVLKDVTTGGALAIKFLGLYDNGSTSYNIYETTPIGDISDLTSIDISVEFGILTFTINSTANDWTMSGKIITGQ